MTLRASTGGLAVTLLVAVIAWFFGTDVWSAILVGGVVTTLGWIALLLHSDPDILDNDWPDDDRRRPGGRDDVLALSRSVRGHRGRVGDVAVGHVTRLAERRLAVRGLDLRRPADRYAIEQLIGRGPYAALAGGRPSLRGLEACLDALDALDVTATGRRAEKPR